MSLFLRSANTIRNATLRPIANPRPNTTSFTRNFRSSAVNMVVHNVSTKDEFHDVINANKVVILDAFATWCGPCKVIAPQVVKYSDEFPDAHFIKVDVDEVPDLAQELGIRAMPTFLVFKNAEKVHEVVGANPKAIHTAITDALKAE